MASGRRSGRAAYGAAGANGPGGQPVGGGSRQTVDQIGGKRGSNDNQVGYDGGKQVKGRKIHALVDSEGLPMRVVVHSAAIQDRDGAGLALDKIRRRFPWLELIWADSGYNAWQVDAAVAKVPLLRLEIVKRSDDMKGFVVLPRRWGGRAHLLLVRPQPASRQGLREPCRNPGHLRHPRLHQLALRRFARAHCVRDTP
jgi:transposase